MDKTGDDLEHSVTEAADIENIVAIQHLAVL
jgi:hypothetical protein